MDTFTYTSKYSSSKRTSVISRPLAEQLADAFEKAGLTSDTYPFNEQTVPTELLTVKGRPRLPSRWESNADLVALAEAQGLSRELQGEFGALPKWTFDVSYVLDVRAEDRRRQARVEAAEAQENPAVRAYLVARAKDPAGRFEPKPADLRWMGAAALKDRRRLDSKGRPLGPTPYNPQPGCTMRLKLSQAVHYVTRQESYADHSEWVVPVEGELGDQSVCRSNLSRFAEALRTTTGMAGEGSSYSFSLVLTNAGWVVVIDQRSSIAD